MSALTLGLPPWACAGFIGVAYSEKNNAGKSKIRGRIEHIFGFMTNSMNDALHLRQIGQQRIAATIGLVNLTYNLFRFEQLIRLKIV